jgi:hypothetical protein
LLLVVVIAAVVEDASTSAELLVTAEWSWCDVRAPGGVNGLCGGNGWLGE